MYLHFTSRSLSFSDHKHQRLKEEASSSRSFLRLSSCKCKAVQRRFRWQLRSRSAMCICSHRDGAIFSTAHINVFSASTSFDTIWPQNGLACPISAFLLHRTPNAEAAPRRAAHQSHPVPRYPLILPAHPASAAKISLFRRTFDLAFLTGPAPTSSGVKYRPTE